MDIEKLIQETLKLREKAHATYSNFRVGAILVTENNAKYEGVNIEISSFGLTICAERLAVFKARADGVEKFKAIFIASDSEKITSPCGACRQVLWELAGDIEVFMINRNGEHKTMKMSQLLPVGFDRSFL
ncbi:MAG: cytidine deaminase [Calditrichaeota bacterium]|nr:cytidine deaminase [Calditrichota bacterium]